MSATTDCSDRAFVAGDLVCEVCVVGSGVGGATAARVLAEAGKDVVLLEEGGDFTGPDKLTQRDMAMYDQVYVDRGGRTTVDRSIAILAGRVLGGGGVINACDVVPVHENTWLHWQKQHGLTGWTQAAMAPFQAQAMRDMAASRIPEAMINRNNQLLRQGAQALGWQFEVMQHNRVGCQGLGSCLIGCPLGAKRNPRMVQIPAAQARGARVYTRVRATRIDAATTDTKTVHCRTMDAKGYHPKTAFSVRAKTVVVACNPVGSVALLHQSGLRHSLLGEYVSLQPQLPIVAQFDAPVGAFTGIPQAVAVTQFEQFSVQTGLGGFRIEAIFGTPGILGSLVSVPGPIGKQFMTQLTHTAAALLLVPDQPAGKITVDGDGRPHVHYTLTQQWQEQARKAVVAAGQIYFAMGAKQVAVPSAPMRLFRNAKELDSFADFPFLPASVPLISAHQQGGARASPSEETGVCKPSGEVWGTKGVYVLDSSTFPGSSSSHTMTPIWTVAGYLAAGIAASS